jgi:hypothetical protein
LTANGTSLRHHDFGRQARWIILLGEMLLWGKGHVGRPDQAVGFVMPGEPLSIRKRRNQHQGGEADDGQAYRHSHPSIGNAPQSAVRHSALDDICFRHPRPSTLPQISPHLARRIRGHGTIDRFSRPITASTSTRFSSDQGLNSRLRRRRRLLGRANSFAPAPALHPHHRACLGDSLERSGMPPGNSAPQHPAQQAGSSTLPPRAGHTRRQLPPAQAHRARLAIVGGDHRGRFPPTLPH